MENNPEFECAVQIKAQSAKAIKVENSKGEFTWLPKSQIKCDELDPMTDDWDVGNSYDIIIPEWLAKRAEMF